MSATLEHIDPRTLLLDVNVRSLPSVEPDFVASIKEHGVLEPIIGWRDGDAVKVKYGQRRTIGAIAAQQETVPVYVHDTEPAAGDLIAEQIVENEHRQALSSSDLAKAVNQMALMGWSADQIATRTAMPRHTIDLGLKVGASDFAASLPEVTLEEGALFAEFEGDDDAIARLDQAVEDGRSLEHVAQRIRDDRRNQTVVDAAKPEWLKKGYAVLDERPHYNDPKAMRLDYLAGPDRKMLTDDDHTGCPGRAVFLRVVARPRPVETVELPDTPPSEDYTVDDFQDGDYESVEGVAVPDSVAWAPEAIEEVADAEHWCLDWRANGHVDRYGGSSSSSKVPVAELPDEEREKKAAERKHVIESNKAWKAATVVRREWLENFYKAKTPPAAAEKFIALAVTGRYTAHHPLEYGKPIKVPNTPKGALQVALTAVVQTWDALVTDDTWRSGNPGFPIPAGDVLRTLKGWGYPTSEIEDRLIAEAKS